MRQAAKFSVIMPLPAAEAPGFHVLSESHVLGDAFTTGWLSLEENIFNITNSVYFKTPGSNIDSATFGRVTSQRNLPPKVQFNARFSF